MQVIICPALSGKKVCRDSGILGVTNLDTGVRTGTGGVGDCPEEIMELWTLLDPASKHAGERLKIAILLDLLADYDTTKPVSGRANCTSSVNMSPNLDYIFSPVSRFD
jgi:hypothetical protein